MEPKTSNLLECEECGTEYCGQCGHNCPGGRWVSDASTRQPVFMNGAAYRDYLGIFKPFNTGQKVHQ